MTSGLSHLLVNSSHPTDSYHSFNKSKELYRLPTSSEAIHLAYQKKDPLFSKELHDNKTLEKYHKQSGNDFIKSIIFGGLDGIVTSFAIIASAHSSHLEMKYITIMGIASILAGAISMGHGDYFSEKAELDYVNDQYTREKWEMDNYPDGEVNEMIDLYTDKHHIEKEDAETILHTMAKYKEFFVDHMMIIELELMPPDPDANPIKNGVITFFSFLIFGSIPVITYIISGIFWVSVLFTLITLGILGAVKAKFIKAPFLTTILNTIFNGALSAGLAYLVGYSLDKWI